MRGKIDESFRDMKNLLNLDKIMNKKQDNMEKMAALLVLAYVIGFLIGEQIRDWEYGGQTPPLPMDSRLCWNNKGYSI